MRQGFTHLEIEHLEQRYNPSAWGDFWGGVGYYGGAALDGLHEGAVNIATGAENTLVEIKRTGTDLVTIYSNWDNINPSQLDSKLFQGAAATAGNPDAAASFDNQFVFGVATLGVGPLVESGYNAVVTGDSKEFSQQAGGCGVVVLVPYAGIKGLNALPAVDISLPVIQPGAVVQTVDGGLVALPGGIAWETVGTVTFTSPADSATALVGSGAVLSVNIDGTGGGGESGQGGNTTNSASVDEVQNWRRTEDPAWLDQDAIAEINA